MTTNLINRNGGNKMLQIENIKLTLEEDEALLPRKAAAALGVPASEIGEIRVLRKAIDAREGVRFVYTLQAAVKNPPPAGRPPPMGRPMGDRTRSISWAVKPSASRRSRVAATFFRLPMHPIYLAGVRRACERT